MNDKQQLAAMGEELRLTEDQAKGLAERLPKTGVLQILDDEPLCMAKRIEELEAQVRVMAGLLREARPYMDHRGGAGVKGYTKLTKDIDAALAGKLPDHIADVSKMVAPEGWQLVPVKPTDKMLEKGNNEFAYDCGSGTLYDAWHAMLNAAPKPEAK